MLERERKDSPPCSFLLRRIYRSPPSSSSYPRAKIAKEKEKHLVFIMVGYGRVRRRKRKSRTVVSSRWLLVDGTHQLCYFLWF